MWASQQFLGMPVEASANCRVGPRLWGQGSSAAGEEEEGTIKTGFGNEKTGKFFKDDPERAFGIESRSLKACHELFEVRLTVQASATLSAIADLLLAGVPFRLMKFSARVLPLTVRNH
jgi:hypothetical protein